MCQCDTNLRSKQREIIWLGFAIIEQLKRWIKRRCREINSWFKTEVSEHFMKTVTNVFGWGTKRFLNLMHHVSHYWLVFTMFFMLVQKSSRKYFNRYPWHIIFSRNYCDNDFHFARSPLVRQAKSREIRDNRKSTRLERPQQTLINNNFLFSLLSQSAQVQRVIFLALPSGADTAIDSVKEIEESPDETFV